MPRTPTSCFCTQVRAETTRLDKILDAASFDKRGYRTVGATGVNQAPQSTYTACSENSLIGLPHGSAVSTVRATLRLRSRLAPRHKASAHSWRLGWRLRPSSPNSSADFLATAPKHSGPATGHLNSPPGPLVRHRFLRITLAATRATSRSSPSGRKVISCARPATLDNQYLLLRSRPDVVPPAAEQAKSGRVTASSTMR